MALQDARVVVCVVGLLVVAPYVFAGEPATLQAIQKLSDEQLRAALSKPAPDTLEDLLVPENLLAEVVRRGGKRWERELCTLIDAGEAKNKKEAHARPVGGVALLTALRRIQGKPDPIQVLVVGKRSLTCEFSSPPTFQVLLTNLDSERRPVWIQAGGDYRSGRQARWRIVVRDAKGHELPEKPCRGLMGGGMFHEEALEHLESWSTHLNMEDYVEIVEPGEYRVEILYHDEYTIADLDNIEGLVVCRSMPLSLRIEPIQIRVTEERRRAIRSWIGVLPTKGPVKMLNGSYMENMYEFIPADSPCGKLLAARWEAVPDMIDAALDPKLHAVRRAQVLALLASITSCNDPRQEPGTLGSYECRTSGWVQFGRRTLSRGDETVEGGEVDGEAALKFAQRWRAWKDKGGIRVNRPQSATSP
jgi:hypothetical protein